MQKYYYMQKVKEVDGEEVNDGPIFNIPLNDWQRHRVAGCVFRTEAEFKAQSADDSPTVEGGDDYVTKDNTKAEIQAFADKLELEYEDAHTKAELLTAIADELDIAPSELGV